jgi:hypothetical protein
MAAIEIVHPDDRAAVHACAVEMLRGNASPLTFSERDPAPARSTDYGDPFTHPLSREPAILGTSLDITELVTAQNQVR